MSFITNTFIAVGFSHLASNVMKSNVENDNAKKIQSLGVKNLSLPQVKSSPLREELPKGLSPSDVCIKILVRLSPESQKRNDSRELAQKFARDLEGHFASTTSLSRNEATSKVTLEIEITAISEGSRYRRYWKDGSGFVRLGLDFSIRDQTKETSPILNIGKIVYADPMLKASFGDRCAKGSGIKALEAIVPVISRQLIDELNLGISIASPGLD